MQSHQHACSCRVPHVQAAPRAGSPGARAAAGCYILRPASFGIWEKITAFFDGAIKALGVQNVYFPLFVTEDSLNTEKEHVEGFAAEVRGPGRRRAAADVLLLMVDAGVPAAPDTLCLMCAPQSEVVARRARAMRTGARSHVSLHCCARPLMRGSAISVLVRPLGVLRCVVDGFKIKSFPNHCSWPCMLSLRHMQRTAPAPLAAPDSSPAGRAARGWAPAYPVVPCRTRAPDAQVAWVTKPRSVRRSRG